MWIIHTAYFFKYFCMEMQTFIWFIIMYLMPEESYKGLHGDANLYMILQAWGTWLWMPRKMMGGAWFPGEFGVGVQNSLAFKRAPYSLEGCQIPKEILLRDAKFPGRTNSLWHWALFVPLCQLVSLSIPWWVSKGKLDRMSVSQLNNHTSV